MSPCPLVPKLLPLGRVLSLVPGVDDPFPAQGHLLAMLSQWQWLGFPGLPVIAALQGSSLQSHKVRHQRFASLRSPEHTRV